MTTAGIQSWLTQQLSERMGIDTASLDPNKPLDEYGLSSLEAVTLTGEIEAHFDCRVEPTALWDHRTIAGLAAHVSGLLAARSGLPSNDEDLDALLLQLTAGRVAA